MEFEQPQANALWYALAHDSKLPKITKKKAPKPTPSVSTAGQPLTVSPAMVKVEILNGSNGTDETATTDTDLTDRGFNVVGTGYADTTSYVQSVIEYGSTADLPAADTLKQQIPDVTLKLVPGLTAGTVDLILATRSPADAAEADLAVDQRPVHQLRRHHRQGQVPQQRVLRRLRPGPDDRRTTVALVKWRATMATVSGGSTRLASISCAFRGSEPARRPAPASTGHVHSATRG